MKSTSKTFARQPSEKYFTPTSLVRDFLAVESFANIFDPCAGAGHIIDAAIDAGIRAFGYDVEPARGDIGKDDFLKGNKLIANADYVTNPPYGQGGKLAVQFIAASLDHTKLYGRKVAMLLHEDFDSAKTRRHLFADHPAFAGKYVLLNRIYWTNLVHTERPSTNHAWFVWDWSRPAGDPYLRYLASSDGKDWR